MSQEQQKLTGESGVELDLENERHDAEERQDFSGQLVPVSEAIKYRKRAQAAEQQVEQLSRQIKESQQKQKEAQDRLEKVSLDNELTGQLMKAGAVDMELALLLAHKKLDSANGQEIDMKDLTGALQNERPFLFADSSEEADSGLAGPTAGVRALNKGGQRNLSRLAQQAQNSGSRKDMQEYLRLRRSMRKG